jgi:hypothetical protein
VFARDIRKLSRGLLRSRIISPIAGEFAPTFNPQSAEAAVAIPNQKRFLRRI